MNRFEDDRGHSETSIGHNLPVLEQKLLNQLQLIPEEVIALRDGYKTGKLPFYRLRESPEFVPLSSIIRKANDQRILDGKLPIATIGKSRILYESHVDILPQVIRIPKPISKSKRQKLYYQYSVLKPEEEVVVQTLVTLPNSDPSTIRSRIMLKESKTVVPLRNLIRAANARRVRLGKNSLSLQYKDVPVIYNNIKDTEPQVLKTVVGTNRNGTARYVYNVPTVAEERVIGILTGIDDKAIEVFTRTPGEAKLYCEQVFYPSLATLFEGKVPSFEEVYQLLYKWTNNYFFRKLGNKTLKGLNFEDLSTSLMENILPYLRGERGNFSNAALFRNFFHKSLKNHWIRQYISQKGKEKRQAFIEKEITEELESQEESPPQMKIQDLLDQLTPAQKAATELYLEGKTGRKIAQILTAREGRYVSRDSISHRLTRARKKVRLNLEAKDKIRKDGIIFKRER